MSFACLFTDFKEYFNRFCNPLCQISKKEFTFSFHFKSLLKRTIFFREIRRVIEFRDNFRQVAFFIHWTILEKPLPMNFDDIVNIYRVFEFHRKSCYEMIKHCHSCQLNSDYRLRHKDEGHLESHSAWEVLSTDVIGPFL